MWVGWNVRARRVLGVWGKGGRVEGEEIGGGWIPTVDDVRTCIHTIHTIHMQIMWLAL